MGKWPRLDKIDMIDEQIDDEKYDHQLKKLQNRLLDLQVHHLRTGGRVVIGIDGWDAAGKGGLIERTVAGLEPKSVHVWRISAPTPEEQGRHYLWRFWNRLPAPGNWGIFDRTWYGRVLVERVEGFASEAEWKRAYDEINEFEAQLAADDTTLIKLFFHVTQETQDKRLQDRLADPWKQWKVGPEDFRNRGRRHDYLKAMKDMFERTDTRWAPWTAIDGNNKKAARIAALTHVAEVLAKALPKKPPTIRPEVVQMAEQAFGKGD